MARKKARSLRVDKKSKDISVLKRVYFDPSEPASFTGVDKLRRALKDKKVNISEKAIKNWLSQRDSYTLHKPSRKTFPRRKIIVGGTDSTWQGDLTSLIQFASSNDGFRYIYWCVDIFSKQLWGRAIKYKTGECMVEAMRDIMKSSGRKPKKFQTDRGGEYLNKQYQSFLKKHGIKHYYSRNDDIKASIVERVQLTMKRKMFRYFTHNQGKTRYLEVLDPLIRSYNHTYNRSIGLTPSQASELDDETVWHKMYDLNDGKPVKSWEKHKLLAVGDNVRILKERRVFQKSYKQLWTDEVFQIVERRRTLPPVFVIKDFNGEVLDGTFYYWELQKVDKSDNVYRVEKILSERKVGGKTQFLVRWAGFPPSYDSYVDKKDIINDYKN